MRPAFDYDGSAVYNIDARDLPSVLDGPVDAVVTDPPYELGLGTAGETARWDSTGIAFDPDFWRAILDVMRPGAFLFAFGSPRTWHRLACAVEDAGFLIRDQLCWLYASGMPKGEWGDHAVDRALGVSDPPASRDAAAWAPSWTRPICRSSTRGCAPRPPSTRCSRTHRKESGAAVEAA